MVYCTSLYVSKYEWFWNIIAPKYCVRYSKFNWLITTYFGGNVIFLSWTWCVKIWIFIAHQIFLNNKCRIIDANLKLQNYQPLTIYAFLYSFFYKHAIPSQLLKIYFLIHHAPNLDGIYIYKSRTQRPQHTTRTRNRSLFPFESKYIINPFLLLTKEILSKVIGKLSAMIRREHYN